MWQRQRAAAGVFVIHTKTEKGSGTNGVHLSRIALFFQGLA